MIRNQLARGGRRGLARLGLALLATVCSANLAWARIEESVAPRVHVTWAPTDQLSEVKDNQMHRGWLRPEDWQKTLSDYLGMRADRLLPPGQELRVTIDDIHLAGSFEPWHGPDLQDVRYMKDVYPPRITLHFQLLAADGSVLREGQALLSDLSYLQRTVPFDTDPLRYDKRLIEDWLRREFRPQ